MTVYKNNRGKWCVDIDFVHPDGKAERIRKTSPEQTKTGAQKYERDVRSSLLDGTYGKRAPEEAPTLAEFQETFMDVYRGEKRKASGIRDKQCHFDAHLIPLFGNRKVDSFRLIDQHKLRSRYAKLSNSRYNGAVAVMNRVIELHYKIIESKAEPFKFELLPVVNKKKPFYDFDQCRDLLDAAKQVGVMSEVVCLLGVDAGLRRSEMFGLTKAHCNMRLRLLIIEQAEVVISTERHMDDTKGLRVREVEMTGRLHDALTRLFALNKKADRVVVNADGRPFTPESFKDHMMMPIQKLAGLKPTGNVHILRHTFCSHLAMRGVPVLTIKELAGHSRIETTLNYMHLAPGEKRRAIDRLEEAPPAELRQPGGNGWGHSHDLA